jgi:hypothetical protein
VTGPLASRVRRLLTVAVVCGCGAPVALGFGGPTVSDARPPAHAAGEDSPWPRTNALRPNVRAAERELDDLASQVEQMEGSAEGYEDWQTCLTYVPVNEQGDRDRQSGYRYDDRDGTGTGYMDGLAVDRRRPRGKEDYLFIHFRGGCRSDSPQPGGTAEPASVREPPSDMVRPLTGQLRGGTDRDVREPAPVRAAGARSRPRPDLTQQVTMLERKARLLFQRSQRLETVSERFDEWESCVSWVPVTEMGDPDQKFGYLFGPKGRPAGHRAGLHVDRSDWDDPDYMFLALVGGDRPGRHCQDEPGEAVD